MNYYWLVWVAVFLAAVFFIWRLNIFVSAIYLKRPDNHSLSVSISLFKRLKLYTFQISPPDFFQDGAPCPNPGDGKYSGAPAEKRQNPSRGGDNFNQYRHLWKKLAANLCFEKFRFRLTYGFEDAALTGVSNGVLSALRGVFLGVCGEYFKMKETPEISFSPVYGHDRLEIEFDCIFSVRLGKVIAIAASVLSGHCNIFKKHPKFIQGDEAQWRNILFRI